MEKMRQIQKDNNTNYWENNSQVSTSQAKESARNGPQSGPESVEEESSKTNFCKNLSQK